MSALEITPFIDVQKNNEKSKVETKKNNHGNERQMSEALFLGVFRKRRHRRHFTFLQPTPLGTPWAAGGHWPQSHRRRDSLRGRKEI